MARMPNFMPKVSLNLITKHRRFLLPIFIVILLILGYIFVINQQNQKKNTERYARELEHCRQIRTAGERYKWSEGGIKRLVERAQQSLRYDASGAARAKEWEDFTLGNCASQRMSKEEASEFEKARELEKILEDIKADRIRSCSNSAQVLLEPGDYNLYEKRVRKCLGDYGIQY